MILNEGNHLSNTPSHKNNHDETEKKSSGKNNGANHTSQSVKNETKTVVVSGITVRNDKFNGKRKNVNRLVKWRCEVQNSFY